ncbi:hypothetical protein FKM82_017004 [Ascaphus truei]
MVIYSKLAYLFLLTFLLLLLLLWINISIPLEILHFQTCLLYYKNASSSDSMIIIDSIILGLFWCTVGISMKICRNRHNWTLAS